MFYNVFYFLFSWVIFFLIIFLVLGNDGIDVSPVEQVSWESGSGTSSSPMAKLLRNDTDSKSSLFANIFYLIRLEN